MTKREELGWFVKKCLVLCGLLAVLTGAAQPTVSNVAFWIVLDDSPSMDWPGHDPQGLRFDAVRLLIDELEQGNSIAVIGFSTKPQLLLELTELTEENKQGLKEALERGFPLRERYWTDIEAALTMTLLGVERHSNLQNVVILLSDGEIELGGRHRNEASKRRLLEQVLPQFVMAQIPIFTIALTSFDASLLQEIAQKTGGDFYQATRAEQLPEVTHGIFKRVFGIQSKQLSEDTFTIAPMTDQLKLQLFLPSEDAYVELIDPEGQSHTPTQVGKLYALFEISEPLAGVWRVLVRSAKRPAEKPHYEIVAESSLHLELQVPERLSADEDLIVTAVVTHRGRPLEPQEVRADGAETVVIGSVEFYVNGQLVKRGSYDAERRGHLANLGRLNEGVHEIWAVLRGELHGAGSTPIPFEIASEKRNITVYTKAAITWDELPAELTRHEPLTLKVNSRGAANIASIWAYVLLPDGSAQRVELTADGQGQFVAHYIPAQTGQYRFVLERSAAYQVEQPEAAVQVVPPRLELLNSELVFHGLGTQELQIRARLFGPDVVVLAPEIEGHGAKVEVASEILKLTPDRGEVSLRVEVAAIGWLAKLRRQQLFYELRLVDTNGVVEPSQLVVPMRLIAPFPKREVLSLAGLLMALGITELWWRGRQRGRPFALTLRMGDRLIKTGAVREFCIPRDLGIAHTDGLGRLRRAGDDLVLLPSKRLLVNGRPVRRRTLLKAWDSISDEEEKLLLKIEEVRML